MEIKLNDGETLTVSTPLGSVCISSKEWVAREPQELTVSFMSAKKDAIVSLTQENEASSVFTAAKIKVKHL